MHVLEASILLIGLVVFSNIISHYLVSIPTALIEITVGVLVALVFNVKIDLEADWFMLLFVAPLLFNDGKKFPKNELWELRAPIFANAIWLVLLTTLLGGFFINFLIKDIPFTLAMALAAVLSPTDPVAVHGIAERVKLPKKILSLISGESLINDASGLIAFKYALAAFLTGQFSLKSATLDFFYMSIVGALIGYVLIQVFYFLRIFLVQQGIRDVVLHTTIRILAPFIIYILADEVAHTSGVIAVVTAGVLSINQPQVFRGEFSEIRLVTHKMWDILIYLLNGAVFVILGIELPFAMSETLINPETNNWLLIFYIFAIWACLLIIRVVWSYSYLWFTFLRKKTDDDEERPQFKTALLTGLTGVRGAITMATVMSIPLHLGNGLLFEQRSLVIFLACGTVVMSLLVATIALPILTKQRKRLELVGDDTFPNQSFTNTIVTASDEDDAQSITEIEARKIMLARAIQALQTEESTENKMVLSDLLHEFEMRLRNLYAEQNDITTNSIYSHFEKEIKEVAINGEKNAVHQLVLSGQISEKGANSYLRFVNFKHQSLNEGLTGTLKRGWFLTQRQMHRFYFKNFVKLKEEDVLADTSLYLLERESAFGAIRAITDYKKQTDINAKCYDVQKHISNQLLSDYRNKIERIKHISTQSRKDYKQNLQEFYLKALDVERTAIQELYENGQITLSLANHLRQSVNYYESSLLQGGN